MACTNQDIRCKVCNICTAFSSDLFLYLSQYFLQSHPQSPYSLFIPLSFSPFSPSSSICYNQYCFLFGFFCCSSIAFSPYLASISSSLYFMVNPYLSLFLSLSPSLHLTEIRGAYLEEYIKNEVFASESI